MAVSALGSQAYAQTTPFPYYESFLGGVLPTGVLRATPQGGMANSATSTTEGLRLTNETGNQFGSILLDGFRFNNANGIQIEFEYIMRGGATNQLWPADGLGMFLYDAAFSGTIGAEGKGLGYAPNRHQNKQRLGVKGGYLMIGLDEYGNSKNQVNGGSSEKMQGLRGNFGGNSIANSANRSVVSIRGAYDRDRSGDDRFLYGYPLLAAQSTIYKKGGGSGDNAGMRLNYSNGRYPANNYDIPDNTFRIRGGTSFNSESDAGYRRASILLTPQSVGGYRITVQVYYNDGNGLRSSVVYNKLSYPTSLKYPENAEIAENDADINRINPLTLNTSVPTAFKIGFAASTGGLNQINIIKNLRVALPYMVETKEDLVTYCPAASTQAYASINPFVNDKFYKGSITDDNTPVGGNTNQHIDYTTFLFVDAEGDALGNIVAGQLEYLDSGKGKWSFDKNTGLVSFYPAFGFVGKATVYYSAKGFGNSVADGPFGQDVYRSVPTIVTAEVVKCGGVINPQLPSGGVPISNK